MRDGLKALIFHKTFGDDFIHYAHLYEYDQGLRDEMEAIIDDPEDHWS